MRDGEIIDLCEATKGKPPRIQSLSLRTVGGSDRFDGILLTRGPINKLDD
jgi:hypothetical protein